MRDMTTPHEDPDRKKVIVLYGALSVTVIMGCIPSVICALLAVVFVTGVLYGAYAVRSRAKPESLAGNHATYIIRTIWIASGIALAGTGAGAALLITQMDTGPMDPCSARLATFILDHPESLDVQGMSAIIDPCTHGFITANTGTLTIAAALSILPVMAYAIMRIWRGLSRAVKGYRLADPKALF